jgi:hypothetical protein
LIDFSQMDVEVRRNRGIGVERTLYALTRGARLDKVDDITCFGKNPDSHQFYLF